MRHHALAGLGVVMVDRVAADEDPQGALRAITLNPAKVLGLADRIGSLKVGKDADMVLWSGDPLDVMQRAMRVFIGGHPVYHYDVETREGVVARR